MSDSSAPRVPSGDQLERAVSLWQQLRDVYDLDPSLAEDEEVIKAAFADAEIPYPETLLERAIDAVVWCERREIEADDIRREVIARRDRYRARAASIRALVAELLDVLRIKSHRAKYGAASLAAGVPSVLLTDADLVPDEFVKYERTVQLTPIKEAIAAGKEVPGAVMSNGGTVLRIRKL